LVKKLGFLLKILSLYPVPVADPGFDLRLSSVPGFCYIAFTILFKMNHQWSEWKTNCENLEFGA